MNGFSPDAKFPFKGVYFSVEFQSLQKSFPCVPEVPLDLDRWQYASSNTNA
jgi:hypothetical protein